MDRTNLKKLFEKFKGGKIAVVGNSDNIYDKENGDLIDTYDCVIRFNSCYVTRESQKYTGKKTNIVILGANIKVLYNGYSELYDKDIDLETTKISQDQRFLNRYVNDFPGCDFIMSLHHATTSNDVEKLESMISKNVFIYPHKMDWPLYKKFGLKNTPTCGLVVLMYLLKFKDELNLEIDLFGFNKEENKAIIYEYYTPKNNPHGNKIYTDKRAKVHRLLIERKIIKNLVETEQIRQF